MNNSSNNATSTVGSQRSRPVSYETIPQVVPIAVLILLTNGVVFLLFYKTKSLRTPANYLLLSLAISDVMTGLINIPLFIRQSLETGKIPTPLYCASMLLHNVTSFSIAYHITAITAEKYLAVVHPFGRNMMTKKAVAKIAFVVWLWSAFLGTAPSYWFYKWDARESLALYLYAGYNIVCLVVVFLLPFTFIIYAYCIMFRAVTKSMRQKDTRAFNKSKNERKCLIILLTMAIAFAICWLPWFTLFLIYSLFNIGWIQKEHMYAMANVSQTFLIIRYLSSAINPLLYTFFKQDFWTAFRVVLLNKHPRRPSMTPSIMMKVVTQRSPDSEQNSTLLSQDTMKKPVAQVSKL